MSGIVITFLALGGFALLLLILSLIGGHLHLGHLHVGHIHFHVGHAHIGHVGHGDSGGELSLPVIAGFLGAFGFGGAIAATLAGGRGTAAMLAALGVGLVAAVPTAYLAGKFVNAAMNMATDGTNRSRSVPASS
ncbi:MAG: hypothetical protein AUI14_15770 [Actinobacteria bacterium 13_2_20CM_2_71_6]|nr:MAG: hypothetical protein AUI14_15770 [Actinobacteria bacterium 13_2_20CM_2_71_6]